MSSYYISFLIKNGDPEKEVEITETQYNDIIAATDGGHIRCQVRETTDFDYSGADIELGREQERLIKQHGYGIVHKTSMVYECRCDGCELWRKCCANTRKTTRYVQATQREVNRT